MVCFKLNKSQFSKSVPGIRAQLYNKRTKMLVDDFIVKSKQDTIHILNAVSPAFTSAFAPFFTGTVSRTTFAALPFGSSPPPPLIT